MNLNEKIKATNPEAWKKGRAEMADRIYAAIGDYSLNYGFESLMTVVGAALVAAHELDGSMPSPQQDLINTLESIARS